MTRQGTREARRWRIILGAVLSIVTFGIALPATFIMAAKWLDRALDPSIILMSDMATILAAFCVFNGLIWITWSYSYLIFIGKGSPVEAFGVALEPTQQLVTFGPYAYLRHPMIFGVLWMLLGVALHMRSLGGVLLVPIIALLAWLHLIIWEEFGLEQRFGEEYRRYRNHVRALIPHLKPYIGEGV